MNDNISEEVEDVMSTWRLFYDTADRDIDKTFDERFNEVLDKTILQSRTTINLVDFITEMYKSCNGIQTTLSLLEINIIYNRIIELQEKAVASQKQATFKRLVLLKDELCDDEEGEITLW